MGLRLWYGKNTIVTGYSTLFQETLQTPLTLVSYGTDGTLTTPNATFVNGTGTISPSTGTLLIGNNTRTVTTAGTFIIYLPPDTPTNTYTGIVSGCGLTPALLVSGTQTITTTATGTLTIVFNNVVYCDSFYYIPNSDIDITITVGTIAAPITLTYTLVNSTNTTLASGTISFTVTPTNESNTTKNTVIQINPATPTTNELLTLTITTPSGTLLGTLVGCISASGGWRV